MKEKAVRPNQVTQAMRPVSFFQPAIQPRLTVNEPGDKYEKEADAVADQVMRMQQQVSETVQCKCTECKVEEKFQRKPLADSISPLVQRKGFGTGAAFLPAPVLTEDGPAQTVFYHEAEGMAAYKILSNMELLMILSAGGGKHLPAYGTAQFGAGYRF